MIAYSKILDPAFPEGYHYVAHGAPMPFRTPTAARTTAFRVTAAIVAVDLFGFLLGTAPFSATILFNAVAPVAALWFFALRADRADQQANELKREGQRILADHVRFAQELAAAITRHPADGSDAQLIRVEIVERFFAHAGRLDLLEPEMAAMLRDIDPLVIADVVDSLTKHHSPLLDEDHVPWAASVKHSAQEHSRICPHPIDLLAWRRSMVPRHAVHEA